MPDGLRVIERLGERALGEVYLAEYPDSHVEVELVVLRPAAGGGEAAVETAGLAHLRNQLHDATRIEHPNIASVRAMGETKQGALWAAFEVCRGKLLSELLRDQDVLSPNDAIELVLQAASGMRAAHEVGLVHGKLSPDTILVTHTEENRPLVKLIGFGLVQQGAGQSIGGAGPEARAWTGYAAPERLMGDSADERSDVFSLGAILQRLLTPASFAGDDEARRIPEAVRRVVAKALEPPPDDRFQTVAAFERALASATTKPPARIRSRARRAGRLGGVLALVVVAVAALWLLRNTQRSKLGDAGDGAVATDEPMTTGQLREAASAALHSTPLAPGSRADSAADPRPASTASDSMLVDVRSVDSTIQVDLRYASANNFTGVPLPGYEAARALLHPKAAAALGRVQAKLRRKGLGLRVFDAYRPVRASLAMVDWAERMGHRALLESGYIAGRSRHNLGGAVDLTLVNLITGAEVPMGTTFDDFTSADAHRFNATGEAARNRQILDEAMESEGFSPYERAWWHFNYPLKGAVPLDRIIR